MMDEAHISSQADHGDAAMNLLERAEEAAGSELTMLLAAALVHALLQMAEGLDAIAASLDETRRDG